MEDDALALAVTEHLGPSALAGGKMSILEAFELGWKAAKVHTFTPLTEAQWREKIGDRQLFTILEAIRFVEKQYGGSK